MSELGMPDLPWFSVKEGLKDRETGMSEWMCHLRPTHSPWEGPEDTTFTLTVRNTFVRGCVASVKSSGSILLCRPDGAVGTAVPDWGA